MLYFAIKEIPSSEMLVRECCQNGEPESFTDFKNILAKIQSAAKKYEKAAIEVKRQFKQEVNYELRSGMVIATYYKVLIGLIDLAIPFYNLMQKIEKIGASQQDLRKYLCEIEAINKKVVKRLEDICDYANGQQSWAMGKTNQFLVIENTFKTITHDINARNLPEPEQFSSAASGKVVKNEISQAEKDRLNTINKANSLFDELCVDFMRDLEKQYAYSSKDLYEKFLKKFEMFTKKYPMPLSSDVSAGYARECMMQIRKLMDMVSEISENSYAISVFN